jgi:hypothetical protein
MGSDNLYFYLHEDEWGMVELLPVENMAGREDAIEEGRQFGKDHSAGVGWTDVYLIPEAPHSIAERHIPLAELRSLVASWLPEADTVQSGYGTYVETLQLSFAFGNRALRSGVFYGNYEGSTITDLNLIPPDEEAEAKVTRFAEALRALAERYNLMLADWWSSRVVDLRDRDAVTDYLRGDTGEKEDSEPEV